MQLERPDSDSLPAESKHASKARATAISFAEKLFTVHKYFVDLLKSQSPAIRSATFSVLRSFIKNVPQVIDEGNLKTLASVILGAFQEKDPSCHSSMWDAVLLFSKRFPNSWTSLNIQKNILNRFWHFLRNGCFGSQQISYPALVLFLDTLPPKAIVGENFFLDFFQNLWAGRNPSHSSNADRLAFFQAFKECLIWGLHNASRLESFLLFNLEIFKWHPIFFWFSCLFIMELKFIFIVVMVLFCCHVYSFFKLSLILWFSSSVWWQILWGIGFHPSFSSHSDWQHPRKAFVARLHVFCQCEKPR